MPPRTSTVQGNLESKPRANHVLAGVHSTCVGSHTPGVQMSGAPDVHWCFPLGAGAKAEEGRGGRVDHAAAARPRSAVTQEQGRLEQAEETRGSREGWGQRPPGQAHLPSEAAPGCHCGRLLSAFTSPGVRTGCCEAETRQHTACPW